MGACYGGHRDAAELLLDRGADANATMTGSVTPLMCAARFNHTSCVRLLLSANSRIDVVMTAHNAVLGAGAGTSALELAILGGGDADIVELLGGAAASAPPSALARVSAAELVAEGPAGEGGGGEAAQTREEGGGRCHAPEV